MCPQSTEIIQSYTLHTEKEWELRWSYIHQRLSIRHKCESVSHHHKSDMRGGYRPDVGWWTYEAFLTPCWCCEKTVPEGLQGLFLMLDGAYRNPIR